MHWNQKAIDPDQGEAIFDGGFYQTVVELFARGILIWKDMEGSAKLRSQSTKHLLILAGKQSSTGYCNGLVAGREHGPAVRTTLRKEQWLAWFQ